MPSQRADFRVAVIGAGMAGLACAQALAEAGVAVRVFDKGRGPGGRMSTRRMEPWQFDHGAQYLTVRHPDFREQVASWESAGVVQPWPARLVELRSGGARPRPDDRVRYVGVPRMNSMLHEAARHLEVRFGTQVTVLMREAEGWRPIEFSGTDLGLFQAVVVALPAPQAVELLSALPALAGPAAAVTMAPCWSVMLSFAQPLAAAFDGAFVADSPLAWAARNNSKPGRPPAEAWVLQATGEWSVRHLETAGEQVIATLLAAFGEALGERKLAPLARTAHRWRYAAPVAPLGESCLYSAGDGIGVCGDWCLEGRVEAAWLSGRALAARLLAAARPGS